jgi:hypothetical protein
MPTRLAELAVHPSEAIRLAVAKNLNATAEVLELVAADAAVHCRTAVVRHPNVKADTLHRLVGDPRLQVVTAIATTRRTPTDVLCRIVAERPEATVACRKIAASRDLPEETFWLLAMNRAWVVRASLGRNPHTPVDVLRSLATDPQVQYFTDLATHPNLPADAITHLAGHPDRNVRRAVAVRKDLTDDQRILIQLAGGVPEQVMSA